MEKLDIIKRMANNAIYYDDNSDFGTALCDILEVIEPGIDLESLEYMEDESL